MAPTASSKSSKAKGVKRTYMERGVVALFQARHNKRMRSVHQSTIRTLVKDNAEERHDILGPNWKKFTTKALNHLKDQGIIAPDPDHIGKVVFTPKGKTILSYAQRDLGIHGTPSTDQEDQIARYVAASVKGTNKRSAPRRSETPRKRRKSGKTKADLEEELREAKEALQEAEIHMNRLTADRLLRSDSPLSVLSDEDDDDEPEERVRVQLPPTRSTESNEEVERLKKLIEHLQQQLAESRRASPSVFHGDSPMYSGIGSPNAFDDDDANEEEEDQDAERIRFNLSPDDDEDEIRTQVDEDADDSYGRLVKPLPDAPRTPRTPQRVPRSSGLFPPPAGIPPQFGVVAPVPQRTLFGLVRTESGSFIHPVSKQATPTPSSPGRDEDMGMDPDVTMIEDDVFQAGEKETQASGQHLATPDTTPERPIPRISETSTSARAEVEKDERIEVLQKEIERLLNRQTEDQGKITSLTYDLTTRNTELQTKTTEMASLRGVLSTKEAQAVELQAERDRFMMEIQANQVLIGDLETQNGSFQVAKGQADARITELDAELQNKNQELAGLHEVLVAKNSRVSDLEAEIVQLTTELRTSNDLLAELRAQNDDLQASKLVADGHIVELEGKVKDLSQEASEAKEKLVLCEIEMSEREAEAESMEDELRGELDGLHQDLGNVRAKFADCTRGLEDAEKQLTNVTLEKEQAIRAGEQREAVLRSEIAALQSGGQQLQDEVRALKERIAVLEKDLEDTQVRSVILEGDLRNQTEAAATLRVELDGARAQLAVVQGQLQATEEQVVLLTGSLESEKTRASDLETERARLEGLASEHLARAQAAEQDADESADLNEKLREENRKLKRIADEYAMEKVREAEAAKERAEAFSQQLASSEELEAPPRKRARYTM
ncbi:hypothetical protein VNI00_007612 [Paramarasmius palmivorus]|uniref:Uncharacterized protein n=1 Tax=Paramarasmius palmivorus TaxID=297713 RepID=A0AAW0D3P3_9AGAR